MNTIFSAIIPAFLALSLAPAAVAAPPVMIEPLPASHYLVLKTAFNPTDASQLAVMTAGEVYLWDRTTKSVLWNAVRHEGTEPPFSCADFSPDGALLMLGDVDGTLEVRDAHTGDVRQSLFDGHGVSYDGAAFSADNRLAVTGSRYQNIRIWDLATGTLRSNFQVPAMFAAFHRLQFTHDNKSVVIGSYGRIYVIDVGSGEVVRQFTDERPGETSFSYILSMDLSADETELLVGLAGELRRYNFLTGDLLQVIPLADGKQFASLVEFNLEHTQFRVFVTDRSRDKTGEILRFNTGDTVPTATLSFTYSVNWSEANENQWNAPLGFLRGQDQFAGRGTLGAEIWAYGE